MCNKITSKLYCYSVIIPHKQDNFYLKKWKIVFFFIIQLSRPIEQQFKVNLSSYSDKELVLEETISHNVI